MVTLDPTVEGHITSSLKGKTALVTGGSRGIGSAIAVHFASKGISGVAITYVGNKPLADETVAKCLELGVNKAIAVQANVLDPDIGPKLIEEVRTGLGTDTLDIIVNNAAVVNMELNPPFEQWTADSFNLVMQGDVYSAASIVRAALPHLPPSNGRIINISSVAGREGPPDPLIAYGAAKAALESLTRSLAQVYARKYSATFNSISVGSIGTEAMRKACVQLPKEHVDALLQRSSIETRVGEPEEVAMIVAWLASDESRWINGASIPANGGDIKLISLQG